MRRSVHFTAHWLLTLLVPTAIVGTTVWFDFHNENVLITDHVWKFVRLTAGGLLVAMGVGAINAVRRRTSWPYVAKLVVYSLVTAGTGAYAMVLADYTRFEKVNYLRLLHDAGFLFVVTFVAIGIKHLEAPHYKRRQPQRNRPVAGERREPRSSGAASGTRLQPGER